MRLKIDNIYHGDCLEIMADMPENCIDLTVTSPPYDNLRTYNGYTFDFEGIASQLYRVTKKGGVVVWVVGDATINGSETGTSFRQALYFMECGFLLHDTMIYEKYAQIIQTNRYCGDFEYMFVLSKCKPKTFNPIMEKCKKHGGNLSGIKSKDGKVIYRKIKRNIKKPISNIFHYNRGNNNSTKDKIAFKHPAIFPEKLASDHIISWSNPGDLILDCFSGSGTTCKMAVENHRNYIGIDISEEYCKIARQRISQAQPELF